MSIAELISAVSIALGSVFYETCANADADRDGTLRINDLVALGEQCPAGFFALTKRIFHTEARRH